MAEKIRHEARKVVVVDDDGARSFAIVVTSVTIAFRADGVVTEERRVPSVTIGGEGATWISDSEFRANVSGRRWRAK